MNQGAAGKLMRTVVSAFLVLGTAAGVAGLAVVAATPAMAQSADEGSGSNEGGGAGQGSDGPAEQVTKLLGGALGGNRG